MCIDRSELIDYVNGNLSVQRMLEVDGHIASCAKCKSALAGLVQTKAACNKLGADLLGVSDCPSYEELSELVDGSISGDIAKKITAHINICEYCSNDIERIKELRSHALLREKISVKPGMSADRRSNLLFNWKHAFGAIGVAAVVTVITFSISHNNVIKPMQAPQVASNQSGIVSVAKEKPRQIDRINNTNLLKPKADSNRVAKIDADSVKSSVLHKNIPSTDNKTLIKDGSYRVINSGSRIQLAKADGSSAHTPLEAKIAAAIEEKIKTGKIKSQQPVMVAMNTLTRGSKDSSTASIAPRLNSPKSKVLMGDRPTLKWSGVDMADSYRVVVTNEDGNVVFDEVTKSTSISLPHPLQRGKTYAWRVGVQFGESNSWSNSDAARFSVLSDEGFKTIQNVKSQMPGSHLALGVTYEKYGLSEQAANEYRIVRRSNSGSAVVRKLH